MASFIATTDDGFIIQLSTFCGKIGTYSTLLGVTAGEITAINNDFSLMAWTVTSQNQIQSFAQNFTNFKDLLRYGHSTDVLSQIPTVPVFGAAPALVDASFSDLVKRIKGSPKYTKTIGEDLGIEVAHTPFDPQLGKPVFKTTFSSGGHPHLIWKKGKFQGIEIWVTRKTGGTWEKLDRDFNPDFTDKTQLPPAGTSEVWSYKMIYLYKDEVVGDWSDVASVTVQGSV